MKIFWQNSKHGEVDDDIQCQEASSIEEFMNIMRLMGIKPKIVNIEGAPKKSELFQQSTQKPQSQLQPQLQIQPQSIKQDNIILQPKEEVNNTKNMEFSCGDVKIKVENGIAYKLDWVEVDLKNFRILKNKGGKIKEVKDDSLIIQKLDWVKIDNSI